VRASYWGPLCIPSKDAALVREGKRHQWCPWRGSGSLRVAIEPAAALALCLGGNGLRLLRRPAKKAAVATRRGRDPFHCSHGFFPLDFV